MYVYFQNELTDDKYVRTSRVYSLANDQLQHWIAELDRFKSLAESLQVNSDFFFDNFFFSFLGVNSDFLFLL